MCQRIGYVEMKLNLGGGGTRIEGYISVDIDINTKPDLVADITELALQSNSIEAIYISHTLEHFEYHIAESLLHKFYDWLDWGGTLFVAVPSFDKLCEIITKGEGDTDYIRGLFYGNHAYPTDMHKSNWTRQHLTRVVEDIGFSVVGTFEPWVNNREGTGSDASGMWFEWSDGRRESLSLNLQLIKD